MLSADLPSLVDQTGIAAETFALLGIVGRASSTIFVGLFETAVNIVRV